MKRSAVSAAMLAFLAACAADKTAPTANPDSQLSMAVGGNSELNGPWNAKVHHIRGWENGAGNANGAAARRSPNMTNHGGKIMTTSRIKAIYWGPSWANATFVGDKITGLANFYTGWNNSPLARTNTEYSGTNGTVGATSTYQGHIIDTSTPSGGGSTSAILAEVCKQVAAGNISVDATGNGYYPVYTDLPRGSAGYCAWHSAGTCAGSTTVIQFAFFWKLDGDAGCDPSDASTGNSQGLAALANVTAHELSEAVTDPASPGAWYDASGNENADKCAWVFNQVSTLSNGAKFKVQGNWSNAAYTAGTGYANSSGQKGCIVVK